MSRYLPTKFLFVKAVMVLLLWAGSRPAIAQSVSSSTKVTLIGQNMPIKSALKTLRQQTGMRFQYEDGILDGQKKHTANFKDQPLSMVLDFLFEGTGISWKISESAILLKKNEVTAPVPNGGPAAERQTFEEVRGTVKDAAGGTIAGATVQVKGTTKGATTDVDGHFTLSDIQSGSVLIISTMGYETREVELKAPSILIGLNLDIRKLDETVIIAYGTTTKRLNTGSVSSVKAKDIEKQPVTNALQALQGRIPGMIITQQSGVPGGAFNVQIRGRNSLRPEGNRPLFIVDGVPYTSSLVQGIGTSIIGEGNPLNYINPADIESVDILKDADATAIYGSRGANGVVLITTKKGAPGKTRLNINLYRGIGKVGRRTDLMNTQQYLAMRREAFKNDNVIPDAAMAPDLTVWDSTRYTDWQDKMIGGTAQLTDIQTSFSGGSDNVQFLIGGGFHRETTVFPGNFADQKGNLHFNVTGITPNRKFKAMLSGSYMADHNNLSNNDFTSSIAEAPNAPEPYKPDGSLNWADNTWNNPFARLLWKYKNNTGNLISNSVFSYQLIPGLEIKTSLGYIKTEVSEVTTYPIASLNTATGLNTGSAAFANNNITSWSVEPQLEYTRTMGKGVLTALIGMSIQQSRTKGETVATFGVTDDALLESLKAAPSISIQSETNVVYKYNAGFARLNYSLLGRYLFNLTARRDGSSRFGPGRQFANFGALGLAWIFSEEEFAKKQLGFLSFGKIRGSYGTTGNDQISDYGYLSLLNPTQFPYQGAQGLYPANLYNPDFAWEINKKLEFGLELGFLKDRLLLTTSYYRNRSSNQLVGFSLPPSTGFNNIIANLPAVVQNTGFEMMLEGRIVSARNFTWSTAFNVSVPNNKLIEYPGIESSSYNAIYIVGQPITIQRLYQCLGADPATGQYIFADTKGNPTLNPQYLTDRTVIINTAPKYYGGLQNTLGYKGFQLDFLFQFVKQVGRNYRLGIYPGSMGVNQPLTVLDRWTKPGDQTNIQRFDPNYGLYQSYDYATGSNLSYSDASFIRLKNLSLSWQLPEGWKKKAHLENCRLYFQAQNLFTITNYQGLDPENQSFSSLPPLRVLTLGFQLTL